MSSSAVTGGQTGVDAGADFCAAVEDALSTGRPEAVSDESLQRVLSAAVRLYAAKSEDRPRELAAVRRHAGERDRSGDRDLRDHARRRPQLLRSADVVSPRPARMTARAASRGKAMNEIMVGELSDFAEGGYRVLRVDTFEFGIFRRGRPPGRLREYLPARRRSGLPGQGDPAGRGRAGAGPDQPRPAFLAEAQHRLSLARLGIRHRVRPPLRRSKISPPPGRGSRRRQPRLCERARPRIECTLSVLILRSSE